MKHCLSELCQPVLHPRLAWPGVGEGNHLAAQWNRTGNRGRGNPGRRAGLAGIHKRHRRFLQRSSGTGALSRHLGSHRVQQLVGVVGKLRERADELSDEEDVGEGVEQRPDMVTAAGRRRRHDQVPRLQRRRGSPAAVGRDVKNGPAHGLDRRAQAAPGTRAA